MRYHGLAWGLLLLSYWSRAQCQSSEWAGAIAGALHPQLVLMFDRQMHVAAFEMKNVVGPIATVCKEDAIPKCTAA